MFLAHPASGLTAAHITRKIWDKKEFTIKERAILYSSAIVSATLPDFDLSVSILIRSDMHRNYITHTPFPYIIATLLICLIIVMIGNPKRKNCSQVSDFYSLYVLYFTC